MPSSLLWAQSTTPSSQPLLTVATQAAALKNPSLSAAERDEAARRLVADNTPAARQALHDALVDFGSRRGQLAAARALALAPDADPLFINDLFALASSDPPYGPAAMQALANYRTPEVRNRLIDLAQDRQERETTRVAAIAAVGTYTDKPAAQALVDLLGSDAETSAIHAAAADALVELTGLRGFGRDAVKWRQWWTAQAATPDADFEAQMLRSRSSRFLRMQHRYEQMTSALETLLADAYQAAPEKSREELLLKYLRSSSPETRVTGVQIVHAEFSLHPISDAVRAQLRQMVGDSSTSVRVAVALELRELNDPLAMDALIGQLHREPDADVRATLVDALSATEDVKVVPELLKSLDDPSVAVAETAAHGLARLDSLVRDKDPSLAQNVAATVQNVLNQRASAAGTASFRAALIDALGPLRIPALRTTFSRMLQPDQPPPVRCSAAAALGDLQQPWAADILVGSLDDPDPTVRIAVLDALKQCATFEHAERIYGVLRDPNQKPAVRQKAWETLVTLFPKAEPQQLALWADRFMGPDEHQRRYIILKQEADQLAARGDAANLAAVQQNIGKELQALDHPDQAAEYLDKALQYYKSKGGPQVTIITINQQEMDALLASAQYQKACDFAAKAIADSPENQEAMGIALRNAVDRLQTQKKYDAATTLIRAIKTMNPPLADQYMDYIRDFERQIQTATSGPATP
jgi:HEAT repeat protein